MKRRLFTVFLALLAAAPLYADVLSSDTPVQSAKIADLKGDVRILKNGSQEWETAQKDQTIEAGDQIVTGKSSFADIAYDDYLLNITHIQENTKAEIRTISPTDIYLEDGSIFSALDGLDEESGYQIATPTAVAAVRGTHFDVAFEKNSQKFTAASLPSGEAGHESKIFVSDPKDPQTAVEVVENKQLDLKFGERPQAQFLRPAASYRLQAGKAVFNQMTQRMPQFQEKRERGKVQVQERREMQAQRRQEMEKLQPGMQNKQNGQGLDSKMQPRPGMEKTREAMQERRNEQGLNAQGRKPFEGSGTHSQQRNRPLFEKRDQNGGPMRDRMSQDQKQQGGPQQMQQRKFQQQNHSGPQARPHSGPGPQQQGGQKGPSSGGRPAGPMPGGGRKN